MSKKHKLVKALEDFSGLLKSGKPLDSKCRVTKMTCDKNGKIIRTVTGPKER